MCLRSSSFGLNCMAAKRAPKLTASAMLAGWVVSVYSAVAAASYQNGPWLAALLASAALQANGFIGSPLATMLLLGQRDWRRAAWTAALSAIVIGMLRAVSSHCRQHVLPGVFPIVFRWAEYSLNSLPVVRRPGCDRSVVRQFTRA